MKFVAYYHCFMASRLLPLSSAASQRLCGLELLLLFSLIGNGLITKIAADATAARYNNSVTFDLAHAAESSSSFQALVVGSVSGHVFVVTSTNRLYQLDSALQLVHNVTLLCNDDDDDSTRCHGIVPQLLLLMPAAGNDTTAGPDGFVLFCSGGLCSLYSSSNLTLLYTINATRFVDKQSTNVRAFIGTAPTSTAVAVPSATDDGKLSSVPLYVASSSSDVTGHASLSNLLLRVPAQPRSDIRAAELAFRFQNDIVASSIRISRRPSWGSAFLDRYVYAFEHGRFAYFVVVQRETPAVARSPLVTRLARFCRQDVAMHSYTELTLECSSSGSGRHRRQYRGAGWAAPGPGGSATQHGVARAARLVARVPGRRDDDARLLVLFDDPAAAAPGSKLCAYSMTDIAKDFNKAQRDCYTGHGYLLEWVHPTDVRCRPDVRLRFNFLTLTSFRAKDND